MGHKTNSDPEIMELARVSCEEVYSADSLECMAEMIRRDEDEIDIPVPSIGSLAYTARMMAGPNPSDDEGEFWDRWKDEMKERNNG